MKIGGDILPEKNVMKLSLSFLAFLFCFFIMNVFLVSIVGFAKDDVSSVISELLSSNTTLATTGKEIYYFDVNMLVTVDAIFGLIGAISTYYYLADRILDLFPFSFSDGDD